jgi:uncharacterized OB-fold protein
MNRVLGERWPLPVLDDANRAFFTAGVLTLQRCRSCAHVQHPPEEVCEACQETELGSFESAGRGRVESVSVAHYPVHPDLADQVPYAIVLVSVDDAPGLLITGNVAGTPAQDIRIGDAVRVVFEDVVDPASGTRLRIPQWEIVE